MGVGILCVKSSQICSCLSIHFYKTAQISVITMVISIYVFTLGGCTSYTSVRAITKDCWHQATLSVYFSYYIHSYTHAVNTFIHRIHWSPLSFSSLCLFSRGSPLRCQGQESIPGSPYRRLTCYCHTVITWSSDTHFFWREKKFATSLKCVWLLVAVTHVKMY